MKPSDYFALGYCLFPCLQTRAPATPKATPEKQGGHHWAVGTEAEWIDLLRRFPGPAVGMKVPVGVAVLDLDMKDGKDGRAALQAIRSDFDPDAWPGPIQRTPSGGGWHLVGLCPEGVEGNSSGSLPPGVDLRANGKGYISVDPTVTEKGAYRWQNPLVDPLDLGPFPDWLQDLMRKRKPTTVKTTDLVRRAIGSGLCKESDCERWVKRAKAYRDKAFDGMIDGMISPPRRHDHLLNCCIKIGSLIAGGICTNGEGVEAVTRIVERASRKMPERERCQADGFAHGSKEPKRLERCDKCMFDVVTEERKELRAVQPVDQISERQPGDDSAHVDDWPELRPLPSRVHAAPPLDPELLPPTLRPWLQDVAEKSSIPLEYVAIPALVALGAMVGRKVGICPERFEPQWCIAGNLWGATVGNSGQKKSTGIKQGLAHIRPIEWALRDEWEEKGPSIEARRVVLERAAKGGRGKQDEAETENAIRELKRLPSGQQRIKTNDATVEKLAVILHENPNGILIERDELSAWLRLMDKPGREGDRGFYLEGWNGDGTFTQDRISRATIHVPAVCLSVIGTLQPGALSEYLEGATSGGSKADGMLQRLQLLAWPDDPPEWHKVERFPDEAAAARAEALYGRLHRATPAALGGQPRTAHARVPGVVFDAPGQAVYDRWQVSFEPRFRSHEFDGREALCSHLSKYRSLMPKLAMLLHLAEHADGSPVGELATMQAVGWVRWLEEHALKVYAPEEPEEMRGARALAEKIKTGAVEDRTTVRAVYRAQWSHLETKAKVDTAIGILSDLGWIRQLTRPTRGGKTRELHCNPRLSE